MCGRRIRIVVNHLSFKERIHEAVIDAAKEGARRLVDAGGLEFRFVHVDERHAILVLAIPDLKTEQRISSEIGRPWMLEHVVPLLEGPPERSSGEVVAGSD